VLFLVGGTFHPAAWAVRDPFGEAHAQAATHLSASLPLRPTLSLRAGVKRVFGTYPFHEAAFIGGADSLRGFSTQRFGGDASALGNAELRLYLGRYFLVLPGEYGVFALADAGRVWVDGERSRRWHTAVGGGLWFAYFRRDHTVTVAAARSDEKTAFYLAMGFGF
jgi:hemolysin activation/secretion protein